MLAQICPILPSRDIDVTEAFYARLGFETWYKDGTQYLLMNRDKVEMHFFHAPDHVAAQSNHGAYLRPMDVDVISREIATLGLASENAFPKFWPAEDKPWGMREATLWDPDGNLIRIGQEIPNWPK